MVVQFEDGKSLLLDIAQKAEITFDGLSEARLELLPPFVQLVEQVGPWWTFEVYAPSRGKIFLGTIRFREKEKKRDMHLRVKKSEPVASFAPVHPLLPEQEFSFPSAKGTLFLHPGEHLFSRGSFTSAFFHLRGEERLTVVVNEGEAVRFEGVEEGRVEGITFFHRGKQKGNVVLVLGGRVEFVGCAFIGGVQEKMSWMGNGVVVARGAQALFRRCVFAENEGAGMVVEKGAQVVVERSLFFRNGREGVFVRRGGRAVIDHSVFRENAWGISLARGAFGEVRNSTVEENSLGGILISREGQGAFCRNRIENHSVGVVQGSESSIRWEENVLSENTHDFLIE